MLLQQVIDEKKEALQKILRTQNQHPSELYLRSMLIYEAWYNWCCFLEQSMLVEEDSLGENETEK